LTPPIHDYVGAAFGGVAPDGGRSVVSGFVYRGSAIPDLQGTYFFADHASAQIWTFRYDGTTISEFTNRTAELEPPGAAMINAPCSFGEDVDGELYIVDRGGGEEIFKIVPRGALVGPAAGTPGAHGEPRLHGEGTTTAGAINTDDDIGNSIVTVKPPFWADLGFSLAGTHGAPVFVGESTLMEGETISLTLTNALENTTANLVVGFGLLNFSPFYGGTLVPDIEPPGFFIALATDGTGRFALVETWPAGVPSGFTLYLQYWIDDAAGPFGFSASNAISGTVP
jgi:hypothetical protein